MRRIDELCEQYAALRVEMKGDNSNMLFLYEQFETEQGLVFRFEGKPMARCLLGFDREKNRVTYAFQIFESPDNEAMYGAIDWIKDFTREGACSL